jgi:hypothetical protein
VNIKRLYFDIETSPNLGFFWQSGYRVSVPYNHIIKERSIICICYKFENDKKVSHLKWDKNQCDKKIIESFIKIMNTADEIVAQNCDAFDIKWLRTRCLYHKIPMFPNYTTLDTLKKSKSGFKFNSNTLDYISQFLGLGQKNSMNFNDWKEIIINNSEKAMDKMIRYCKKDVILLQKVYKELSPYITNKVNHSIIY